MFAPNWSVFVEYDYLDFGTASVFFGFPAGSIPPSNTYQITQLSKRYWPASTFGLASGVAR